MKFRNDTETDINVFGLDFAEGNTVEIPERVSRSPQKIEWLRANFTEVTDEPEELQTSTPIIILEPTTLESTESYATDTETEVAESVSSKPTRKRKTTRTRSQSAVHRRGTVSGEE